MNAHRFDPFFDTATLQRLQKEFGRFVDSGWLHDVAGSAADSAWHPAADSVSYDGTLKIALDLPGVDPATIDVFVHRGVLVVSGSRVSNDERSADSPGKATRYQASGDCLERPMGSFRREFPLPEGTDETKIEAQSNHGVLTLTIPSTPGTSAERKININVTS